MLHVKLDNNSCNGFREKLFEVVEMLFLEIRIGAK